MNCVMLCLILVIFIGPKVECIYHDEALILRGDIFNDPGSLLSREYKKIVKSIDPKSMSLDDYQKLVKSTEDFGKKKIKKQNQYKNLKRPPIIFIG